MRSRTKSREVKFWAMPLALCGLVLAASVPASAEYGQRADGTITWSQEFNGRAFPSHPDCRDTQSGNGPCVMWPRDTSNKAWAQENNAFLRSVTCNCMVNFHDEIQNAVTELDNQTYRSPRFPRLANPCDVCITIYWGVPTPNDGRCADTGPIQTQGPAITSAQVTLYMYNDQQGHYLPPGDGQPIFWAVDYADVQSGWWGHICVLRGDIRHELGHAIGEGHATASTDLMCSEVPGVTCADPRMVPHGPQSFDTDFQSGLNTMYGLAAGDAPANCSGAITLPIVRTPCQ